MGQEGGLVPRGFRLQWGLGGLHLLLKNTLFRREQEEKVLGVVMQRRTSQNCPLQAPTELKLPFGMLELAQHLPLVHWAPQQSLIILGLSYRSITTSSHQHLAWATGPCGTAGSPGS